MHTRSAAFLAAIALAAATAGTVSGLPLAARISKPLLMPILLVWWLGAAPRGGSLVRLVTAALVFSWLGDVFLMGSGEAWFGAGLGSFLVAQLCYAAAFLGPGRDPHPGRPWQALVLAAIVIAVGLVVARTVLARVPAWLVIPVSCYAAAITAMGTAAALRAGGTSLASWAVVFVGAEWFMVSDSLLAVDRFVAPLGGARIAVMLTYCLGQWLIVAGCLDHLRRPSPWPTPTSD